MIKIKHISVLFVILVSCSVQIGNAVTEVVKVNGNCSMCKKKIEATSIKGVSKIVWNQETKKAKLVYDKRKTSRVKIMNRIAEQGYDNEDFCAKIENYEKLHYCCQYTRTDKCENDN